MIIYFTGTGNSRYIAKKLASLLEDKTADANQLIKEDRNAKRTFASEKPYVFVTPTYAYRMPHLMEEFIRSSAFSGNKDAYFFLTCGADTGSADNYARSLCEEKNLNFKGLQSVVMPDNYLVMYPVEPEETDAPIIEKATALITESAKLIQDGTSLPEHKPGLVDKLKSGPANELFYKILVNAKKFRTTDACISCGLCTSVCPLNNIRLENGKPVWSDRCTHCMACICRCPKSAIEFGKSTEGRRRYYHPE